MNYVAWTSLNLTAFSSPLLAPSLSGFFSSPTRTYPTWTSLRHLSFPAREPAVSISPPYLLLYPFLPSTLVALVFSGMEADLTRGLKARSVTLAMRFGCLASIRYSQLIGHWVGCLILGSLTRSIRLSISNLHHSIWLTAERGRVSLYFSCRIFSVSSYWYVSSPPCLMQYKSAVWRTWISTSCFFQNIFWIFWNHRWEQHSSELVDVITGAR